MVKKTKTKQKNKWGELFDITVGDMVSCYPYEHMFFEVYDFDVYMDPNVFNVIEGTTIVSKLLDEVVNVRPRFPYRRLPNTKNDPIKEKESLAVFRPDIIADKSEPIVEEPIVEPIVEKIIEPIIEVETIRVKPEHVVFSPVVITRDPISVEPVIEPEEIIEPVIEPEVEELIEIPEIIVLSDIIIEPEPEPEPATVPIRRKRKISRIAQAVEEQQSITGR